MFGDVSAETSDPLWAGLAANSPLVRAAGTPASPPSRETSVADGAGADCGASAAIGAWSPGTFHRPATGSSGSAVASVAVATEPRSAPRHRTSRHASLRTSRWVESATMPRSSVLWTA